jgi:tRNA threonylcarbamoyladenosine biosynthesis protein TsaB
MKLLALETSTERLSLAAWIDGQVLAREVDAGQRHSELALPLLHELLHEAKVSLCDFDAISFGQGPGSFTGVRIACGLAQGIALGAGKRIIPVPTQMALAEQAGTDHVVVALDARMGEIYLAAYIRAASTPTGWLEVVAPLLARPDLLPDLPDRRWIGIGSAFDVPLLADVLDRRYGDRIGEVIYQALPSARGVAAIAARSYLTSGCESAVLPEHAAPLYLRNKVAMTIAEREAHHSRRADHAHQVHDAHDAQGGPDRLPA